MSKKKINDNWQGSQTFNSLLAQPELYETYDEWLTKERPPSPEISKEEYEKKLHEYITESYKDSVKDALINAILWKFHPKLKGGDVAITDDNIISIPSDLGVTEKELMDFVKTLRNDLTYFQF